MAGKRKPPKHDIEVGDILLSMPSLRAFFFVVTEVSPNDVVELFEVKTRRKAHATARAIKAYPDCSKVVSGPYKGKVRVDSSDGGLVWDSSVRILGVQRPTFARHWYGSDILEYGAD